MQFSSALFSRIYLPKAVSWLGGLGVLFYFLFPYTPSFLPMSPHLFFIIPAFILAVFVCRIPIRRTEIVLVVLLALLAACSLVFSPHSVEHLTLRNWGLSLATFWVCRASFSSLSNKAILMVASILICLYAASSFVQVITGNIGYVSEWFGAKVGTRFATGLASYPNQAALLMGALFFLTAPSVIDRPSLLKVTILLAGAAAIYLTLSRAGWAAFVLGFFLLLAHNFKDNRMRRNASLLFAASMVTALITWSIPSTVSYYAPGGEKSHQRWAVDNYAPTDFSSSTRIATLAVARIGIGEHPLLGIGLGAFPDYYSLHREEAIEAVDRKIDPREDLTPHNAYAQIAVENGLPAFFCLMAYFLYMGRYIFRDASPLSTGIAASLIAMAFFMIFHDGFHDRLVWILFGTGMGVANRKNPAPEA